MFDQPVVSRLAATHLATHERETYYYKVGVTSLCQSQSAGLAFLNSCGCQLLAISATTELGAFLSLTIRVATVGGGGDHTHSCSDSIESHNFKISSANDLKTTRSSALT